MSKKIYLTEEQLSKVMDYTDNEMPWEEFADTFDDEREANFMYNLGELVSEAKDILDRIRALVEDSDYATECSEKVKPYVEKLADLTEKMDNFLF